MARRLPYAEVLTERQVFPVIAVLGFIGFYMFEHRRVTVKTPAITRAAGILELIYHSTVRQLRKNHGNPVIGLLLNILQTALLAIIFFVMFSILGLRGMAIRGDFMLYLMSGIFLFMTHTKVLTAVVGSEGPTSAMMKHAPMNTVIAISAAALATLYIQILSVVVILYIYHAAITPIYIHNWVGALGMLLLAWFSGVAVGMLFLALKPWFPNFTDVGSRIYVRANMLASGKMFVANQMPGYMLAMFTWNPLFHCIDQARGYVFVNYTPHHSSPLYPLLVSLALIMIGLLGEFYTRKRASLSWSAGR